MAIELNAKIQPILSPALSGLIYLSARTVVSREFMDFPSRVSA